MGRVPLAGVRPRRRCSLISRNGNQFKSFPALAENLPAELRARSAILDGEIVCLDRHGKTQFKDLLFRSGEPRFYTFDLLWADGEDLRHLPLIAAKSGYVHLYRGIMGSGSFIAITSSRTAKGYSVLREGVCGGEQVG